MIRWGWLTKKGVQEETFKTPNDAIEGMQKRLGIPDFTVLDAYEQLDAKLCLVEISIKPLMTLEKP